jgi:diguanylate cyclase
MSGASIPLDEASRLRSLVNLRVLDTAPEAEFDALVQVAALVCGVPIALLSLVDESRQWFKANVGLPDLSETPREIAFCAHAIHDDALLEIPDATQDPRFIDNPLVLGAPDIRFYAGAPIRLSDGKRIGTLCVIDRQPRVLNALQREVLTHLSYLAAKGLEARVALRKVEHLSALKVQSDHYLRQVVSSVPAMLSYWDRDLRCKFANPAYKRWFGVNPEALVGEHIQELLGPDLFVQNKPLIDATLSGLAQTYECLITDPGGVTWHSLTNYAPDIVNGHVVGFLMHVNDVSALKKAEETLLEKIAEQNRTYQLLSISNAALGEAQRLGRIGSWTWNAAADIASWSDELFHMFGREAGSSAPSMAEQSKLYSADSLSNLLVAIENTLKTGEPYLLVLEFTRPDGTVGWLESRGEVRRDEHGVVVGLQGTALDITERQELNARLGERNEMLRVTLQSIGDAVITTNNSGQVNWMNPVAEQITGWLSSEALGRPHAQVFHIVNEETRRPSPSPVDVCLQQGAISGSAERIILLSRNGREFGIEHSAAPILNANGHTLGVVLVFHDVTEQRRLSGEMSYRATHDALTDLTNRSEFESRLRRTLDKAHADNSSHVLMFIDLDQFKLVNDACGHSAGDLLLQQVAKFLREAVRGRDTLARLGGDEFAIILEQCSLETGSEIAQKICDRMDEFRFLQDGGRFRIGTSIGLVPLDRRWATAAAALQAADDSCYAAKEAGRNRVHVWYDADTAMHARHGETQWAARLEQAIDDDGFILYAQKIVPLLVEENGLYAEVLLRMTDSDGSLIAPNAFLPAAERFHFCSRIDKWVLRQVINALAELPDLNDIDTICVNLSGQSVGDRVFHRQAVEILGAAGGAICQRLCLEVTETAAITNMTEAALFINEVRLLGVRIALDDFGSGASSFGYLKSLSVDVLKIDGQFVRDVIEDPLDNAAVRCFVEVAAVVGVKTVAEFIDKPAVLERMKEFRVDYGQGFLLHLPEPLAKVLDQFARQLST